MFEKLERMQKEGTPLIDGTQVTFLWVGKKAPQLRGDFCGWEAEDELALKKVATNLWGVTLSLPEDGYFEYAFFEKGERLLDPSNRKTTPNGMGKTNNYFWMPQGQPTGLTNPQRGVPHGTVKTVEVDLGPYPGKPHPQGHLLPTAHFPALPAAGGMGWLRLPAPGQTAHHAG